MNPKTKMLLCIVAFAMMIATATIIHRWLQDNDGNNLIILSTATEATQTAPTTVTTLPETTATPTTSAPPTTQVATTEPPTRPQSPPTSETPAPDFTFHDAEGNPVQLSDFFGKPIVLNFWATWCMFCVQETPYFQGLYEDYGDYLHVLKVNWLGSRGETHEIVENFMADGGYTFPVFFDTNAEGVRAYGVSGIPTTFFIDRYGNIAAAGSGAMNAPRLALGLDAILHN